MRRIRILDEAAEEAIEAAAWYEHERPGLGVAFSQALNRGLDLLEDEVIPLTSMPGVAGRRGIKRLILKRFPYNIVVQEHAREIVVVAVAHQSKRPGYWRGRLRT